jgi:Domain of unknown function (DUF1929)/Carbohydrate binding module (family 6)
MKVTTYPKTHPQTVRPPRDRISNQTSRTLIKKFIAAMVLQRKPMTIKTRTITSSLAALILPVLLMACPGGNGGDPTLCNGSGKTTDVGIEGATVQAEDYSSATTGVERRQLSGGPCSLRATSNEGSGEYTLKIAQANDFDVTFNLNASAGTKLRLELDGNPVDNTDLTATATTGNAFKDFTLPVLTLPAGEHKLRVVVADLNGSSAVMIDSFKLTKPAKNLPYGITPPSVPFRLEAEHFDRGGEVFAYTDTTPGNSGAGTRISSVDVDVQGQEQFVTDTQPDETLKYSFNVTQTRKLFKVSVWYASSVAGGKFSLGLGGRKLIDKATVKATTSNTVWREESVVVPIQPGASELVLSFDSLATGATSVMNVDRLEVVVDSDIINNDPPVPPGGVIGAVSPVYQWGDGRMPIHAALMPNGKVYAWGGGKNYDAGTTTMLLDPSQGGQGTLSTTPYPTTTLFCAGFSHLPDGRLLIAGGHWDNFQGVPDTNIYDSAAGSNGTTSPTSSMFAEKLPNAVGNPKNDPSFNPNLYYADPKHTGRWYPSTTPLANGEIMVSEGYSSIQSVVNNLPEVWETNTGGGWRTLDNAKVTDTGALSYYPFMYPRPNGEVVRIGPEPTLYAFKTGGTGDVRKFLNKRPDGTTRDYGSAAMFRPGKILLVGGNGGDGTGRFPLSSGVVVNINNDPPTFDPTPDMNNPRRHLSTTILPTGDVLISGGSSGKSGHNLAPYAYPLELYNVGSDTFRTLANLNVGRGYHSIALLLPDGRILIGGGGSCGGCQTNGDQNNIEYYKPPYLFKPNGNGGQTEVTSRPEIIGVTNATGTAIDLNTSISYGQDLKITVNLATTGKIIKRVTMIKLGAVTHARNFDQNFNELLGFTTSGSILTATLPADSERAYATPGHYMVFAIDEDGVPSIAKIIKLQ